MRNGKLCKIIQGLVVLLAATFEIQVRVCMSVKIKSCLYKYIIMLAPGNEWKIHMKRKWMNEYKINGLSEFFSQAFI